MITLLAGGSIATAEAQWVIGIGVGIILSLIGYTVRRNDRNVEKVITKIEELDTGRQVNRQAINDLSTTVAVLANTVTHLSTAVENLNRFESQAEERQQRRQRDGT